MSEKRKSSEVDLNNNKRARIQAEKVDQVDIEIIDHQESIINSDKENVSAINSTVEQQSVDSDIANRIVEFFDGKQEVNLVDDDEKDAFSNEQIEIIQDQQVYHQNLTIELNKLKEIIKVNMKVKSDAFKEHLQPLPKKVLFSDSDLLGLDDKLRNFQSIIDSAIKDYRNLFTEDELQLIQTYKSMSKSCQIILMLLLFKKHRYVYVESLNFKMLEIDSLIEILVNNRCLDDNQSLSSLEEALYVLDLKEINEYAKKWKINTEKSKLKIINTILSACKLYLSVDREQTIEQKRLNVVKKDLAGKLVKINQKMRNVLMKVLLLEFQPPNKFKDVGSYYTGLLLHLNDVLYTSKHIAFSKTNRTIQIYTDSTDINRYVEACLIELKLNEDHYCHETTLISILDLYEESIRSKETYGQDLPDYLLKFTAKEKTAQLIKLVKPLISNDTIEKEIDEFIDQFIGSTNTSKLNEVIEIVKFSVGIDQKTVKKDRAKLLEDSAKQVHEQKDSMKGVLISKPIIKSTFISLFHDIIFIDVENTFIYKMQMLPLDLASSSFEENRQTEIEIKSNSLSKTGLNEIKEKLVSAHKLKYMRSLTGLIKADFDLIKDLISTITKQKFIEILKYTMKSYESSNPLLSIIQLDIDEKEIKFIQVKEEGVHLTDEQIDWLNFIHSLNLNTEVWDIKFKSIG